MRSLIIVVTLLFFFSRISAQSDLTYNRAIGVKLPVGFAVSYKQFVQDEQNVEAQVIFWNHSFVVTGLYEFNWEIPGIDGLRWYVGPGAHLGFRNATYNKSSNNNNAGFGIDGVLGLDYKLADLPLNISLDWQPAVDLVGSTGDGAAYGGIGVRYTF